MDHKNLTYFCGSKVLSWCQARWSEFLSQFNLLIQFRPGRLGTKPDALTWQQDVFQKDSMENNQTRRPIFTTEQLNDSQLRTGPFQRKLQATIVLNTESLLANIRIATTTDPFCKEFFDAGEPTDNPKWTRDINGHLCYEERIFLLDSGDLCLKVLKAKYDHLLADHPGQSKTLQLVCHEYTWLKLKEFVTSYVNSCNTCSRNKPRHYKPYGLLK